MYCTKCGKPTGTDEIICDECKLESVFPEVQTPTRTETPTAPIGDRKEGLKGAIASIILSVSSLILTIIALMVSAIALDAYDYDPATAGVICFLLSSLSLAAGVVGIVLGAKGMKCFFRAKNAGRVKPIATLVCGIVGLAMGVFSMIYVSIDFIFVLALFAV